MSNASPGSSPTPFPFNLFELHRAHRDEIDILADEASLFILAYTNHVGTTTGDELARELNLQPDVLIKKLGPVLHGQYITEDDDVFRVTPSGRKLLQEVGYLPPPAQPRTTSRPIPRAAPATTMPVWMWIIFALVGGSMIGLICVLLGIYFYNADTPSAPTPTLIALATLTHVAPTSVPATETITPPPPPMPSLTTIPTNTLIPTQTANPTNTPTQTSTPTNTPTFTLTPSTGSLCVYVFNDLNGNGVPDNEPLLPNAGIVVKNANGETIANALSQPQPFCFTNLLPGNYSITETNPPGYPFSTSPNFVTVSVTLGGIALVSFGNYAALTPTPTPTLPSPTPGFMVTGIRVDVSPISSNTCPATFTFLARITANGIGTVRFQWERSDGTIGSPGIIAFTGAGTLTVADAWIIPQSYSGWERLRVLDPNAVVSNQAVFTTNCGPTPTLTITPRGGGAGRIAFQSARVGYSALFTMNADGTLPVQLTRNDRGDHNPAWSPDGRRIVFDSNRDGNPEIYVMNADGTAQVRITFTPVPPGATAQPFSRFPNWSPDGTRIVFESNRSGYSAIWMMNPDGSNLQQMTFATAGDSHPVWSPDGKKIAFQTLRDGGGTYEIYVINADGSAQTRLTRTPGKNNEGPVSWSSDSKRIAFSSNRENGYEVWVMNADGTSQTRLTNNADSRDPDFSPDSRLIIFTTSRDGNNEVYLMNADGTGQINLSLNPADDARARWQPPLR